VFLWFLISLLLAGTSGASSHDIAVDREDTVYVTGQTSSAHYPTTAAFDTTLLNRGHGAHRRAKRR
jgi:hypothetical protein